MVFKITIKNSFIYPKQIEAIQEEEERRGERKRYERKIREEEITGKCT